MPGFFASEQSIVNPSYGVRGITTDNVDPRSEERVSVYQDAVPISRTSGASVAPLDIDHIEIQKGSEPTRFLRAVQAGAVSIVSHRATNEKSADITLGANFSGNNLGGQNLAGVDLTGIDGATASFASSDLSSVNFTNANLADADFQSTLLGSTIFSGANLASGRLRRHRRTGPKKPAP